MVRNVSDLASSRRARSSLEDFWRVGGWAEATRLAQAKTAKNPTRAPARRGGCSAERWPSDGRRPQRNGLAKVPADARPRKMAGETGTMLERPLFRGALKSSHPLHGHQESARTAHGRRRAERHHCANQLTSHPRTALGFVRERRRDEPHDRTEREHEPRIGLRTQHRNKPLRVFRRKHGEHERAHAKREDQWSQSDA